MQRRTIYFDYNATTPLDPHVRAAMLPFLDSVPANASSVHHLGRQARTFLDEARERVGLQWHCKPTELVFTSGGTESNNLAVLGAARALKARGRHLLTTQIEHHSVLDCFRYLERYEGFQVTYIKPDNKCYVSANSVLEALREDTVLVSVMALNNETGARQPVAEIGALCRERGICFHTDAAQWFGKEEVATISDFHADLVSACGHKLHGPKGAGLLYIRSPLKIHSTQLGGPQEDERRAGTENLACIAGMVRAFELFTQPPVFKTDTIFSMKLKLSEFLSSVNKLSVVQVPNATGNTLCFTVEGADSATVLAALDLEGICASSGSACMSGSLQPSHVLLAMGYPQNQARSLVRLSIGRENTQEEVEYFSKILPGLIQQVTSS